MTQKEKQILIRDLCARLPYGTYVHHKNFSDAKFKVIAVFDDGRLGVTENEIPLTPTSINECKPYLRPMSNMTEEERDELASIQEKNLPYPSVKYSGCDYLNSIHVDYRGLIPMGLALEAKEGMYKTE